MVVIPPIDLLNTAMVTTNSIAVGAGDPAAWNASTNYSVGSRVRVDAQKKTYENLLGGVNSDSPETAPTRWTEVGYMNRYAMFDNIRDTKSYATNTISVVIAPDQRVNSLAILGMENVDQIIIVVRDSFSNVILNTTVSSGFTDTYINLSIPPAHNSTIEVTASGTGTIAIGAFILGTAEYLGDIQGGASIDTLNFSTVTRDTFGYTSMLARRSVPLINCTLLARSGNVPRIYYVRSKLNAVPAVWCGMEYANVAEYYEPLVILGFYKQFSIVMESPIHSTITLELEEI